MSLDFIAVDVEMANASNASICQIGLVAFGTTPAGPGELWRWSSLVDPGEHFDAYNYRVHKIHPRHVAGAPAFPAVFQEIVERVRGRLLVSYGNLDPIALVHASQKYGLVWPDGPWLDVHRVVQRTWPGLKKSSLGEKCRSFGLEFQQHDAVWDAWACGMILLQAQSASGAHLDQLVKALPKKQVAAYPGPVAEKYPILSSQEARAGGPLSGNTALFTGQFKLGKYRMGAIASELGCSVRPSYAREVTLLVCGWRDPAATPSKSKKLLIVEAAQRLGSVIEVWTEAQFIEFVRSQQPGLLETPRAPELDGLDLDYPLTA